MSGLVRLAGQASLADGSSLVWSVADGRRGRRWRAIGTRDAELLQALLLEIDTDGRLARLELATAIGLLTLHPDAPRTVLHGNAVTAAGVRHLTVDWSADHALAIEGEPIADAATVHRLTRSVGVGEGRQVPIVIVGQDLAVRADQRRFERRSSTEWLIEGDAITAPISIDEQGILTNVGDERRWPLELDGAPVSRRGG